ncbi:hypothetical protein PtA15_14A340 [Puccinia triticina]|uniref:Uncharacterized protein n=2 Tax=Puccinia triticina TaxID=208348 RepID=A0ABY7D222_9BASI|nr:uncharacterized protein PtA15_14A340 [Puccinia triticina]WAQ91456.1 hypothetical protein PtA15_14A340 [Puccinia triticina]
MSPASTSTPKQPARRWSSPSAHILAPELPTSANPTRHLYWFRRRYWLRCASRACRLLVRPAAPRLIPDEDAPQQPAAARSPAPQDERPDGVSASGKQWACATFLRPLRGGSVLGQR